MIERLAVVIMVALAAAFVVLVMKKWGVTEWYQVHGDRFTSQLFSCDLCMSFWASVLMTFCAFFFVDAWWLLTVPVFSTPITRMLV